MNTVTRTGSVTSNPLHVNVRPVQFVKKCVCGSDLDADGVCVGNGYPVKVSESA